MISEKTVYAFCKEDLSLIENFDKAMNDTTQTWICHHRLEILKDKNLSKLDLINLGMYYNRPASELIFMTKTEHRSMHAKIQRLGLKTWNKGKKGISEETRLKMRNAKLNKHFPKMSECKRGKRAPIYGKHKVWNDLEHTKYHFE